MDLLHLTLPTPAENLALDEALADALSDADPGARETLRLWAPPEPVVVLGRSSRVDEEVDLPECRRAGVPIQRRASGGATILTGPGCLMYAVTLDLRRRPELRQVDRAHAWVLGLVARALGPGVRRAGTSDLVVDRGGAALKVSGNSLRVRRDALVYHGTLMHAMDLGLVARLLREPPRQPEYRARRRHADFVANLDSDEAALCAALCGAFGARAAAEGYPAERVARLVEEKHSHDAWNLEGRTPRVTPP